MNQENHIQNTTATEKQPWWKTKTAKVGIAGGIIDGALDFAIRRYTDPEENIGVALAKSAATAAAWVVAPTIMWGVTGVQMARATGQMMGQYRQQHRDRWMTGGLARPNFGGEFYDTEMTYTMRQRGVQAIQASRLNARSALMNEARSLHRM